MTAIPEKTDYIGKAKQLLNDTTTYRLLDADLTAKLEEDISEILSRL